MKPRTEQPSCDSFNSFFIQPQTETLHDLEIARMAASVDFDREYHDALVLRLASFFREFGLDLVNELGWRDIPPASGSNYTGSAGSWSDIAAAPRSDSSVAIRAEFTYLQLTKWIADLRRVDFNRGRWKRDAHRHRQLGIGHRSRGNEDVMRRRRWRAMPGWQQRPVPATRPLLDLSVEE